MSLRKILQKDLVSCSRATGMREASELMRRYEIGAVVVVDEGKPVGILTDRDLVVRCLAEGVDCVTRRVEDVMTKNVATVSLDQGIFNVTETMRRREVRRVVVVDEMGMAIGLLSFGDIFELVSREIFALASTAIPEDKKIEAEAA